MLPDTPPAQPGLAPQSPAAQPRPQPHLSMQIFSTWGTSTCSSLMMVCSGSFDFQERTWGRDGGSWAGKAAPRGCGVGLTPDLKPDP